MREQLVFAKDFIFDADNEKGFAKLKDNQFPGIEQGIVYEPLANALDQQQGGRPVEIALKKEKKHYRLSFSDNGDGLTRENLEALHYIGKSTKKEKKADTIGRFGMGLTGAFHSKLGLLGVEIETKVCGRPSIITYDCSGPGIPLWRRKDFSGKCRGFTITFVIPAERMPFVKGALETLLSKSIVPIRYNGRLFFSPPAALKRSADDITITEKGDHQISYTAHVRENTWSYGCVDDISIYLKGMPVEEGGLYHIFQSLSGDKMPQNYHGTPYMKHETCVVSSRKAEPTVGRDKVVRNEAFQEIRRAVEGARVRALRELLRMGRDTGTHEAVREYAKDMAMANLLSLSGPLKEYLKGKPPASDKGYLVPLFDDLLSYPLFPALGGKRKRSVREIIETEMPGGVYLFASEDSAADFISGAVESSFVLLEHSYLYNPLWGGHTKHAIGEILKPLVESREGREMVFIDDLRWNDRKIEELRSKGIIGAQSRSVKIVSKPDEKVQLFMNSLKVLLNRGWFRDAIAVFHPPRRIHLKPIEAADTGKHDHPTAGILGQDTTKDELFIGIYVDSPTVRVLSRHPSGHLALLPVLCHELAHRRRMLMGSAETRPRTHSFYIDRIRLEDRVLSGCVKYLLGVDESRGPGACGDEDEIVVL